MLAKCGQFMRLNVFWITLSGQGCVEPEAGTRMAGARALSMISNPRDGEDRLWPFIEKGLLRNGFRAGGFPALGSPREF